MMDMNTPSSSSTHMSASINKQQANDPNALVRNPCTTKVSNIEGPSTSRTYPQRTNPQRRRDLIRINKEATADQPCIIQGEQNNSCSGFKLALVSDCQFCGAKRIQYESPGFCCCNGQVSLVSGFMPLALKDLFIGSDANAKSFQTCVRTYNNTFAFTSMGVYNVDKSLTKNTKGVYTFKVQGQVYHHINDLLPTGQPPKNLQLYFYDTDQEIKQRLKATDRLLKDVVTSVVEVMSRNPYAQFFKSLRDIQVDDDFCILLHNNASLDQRVFNLPTVSQVGAIWIENNTDGIEASRSIKVYGRSGSSHYVKYYYGCYDPLQYPLLFPHGESGWHEGIPKISPYNGLSTKPLGAPQINPTTFTSINHILTVEELMTTQRKSPSTVSVREYYAFKFQIRQSDQSLLLHTGRLLQQFIVDIYIKIETQRLDYFRLQQREARLETYQGLVDSFNIGVRDGIEVGKHIVLPATFIGGPRDMRRRYMDAMTLVQRFGKPDIFLTITCNPNCPEIKELLQYVDLSQNRPDLIARIFRAKIEELKKDLFKKKIFGEVAAYTYVIEFQKRGLPHAHFLIILQRSHKINTAAQCDRFVCAEIPDQQANPKLFDLVIKHMMHGPCGHLNPENVCMRQKENDRAPSCKDRYPQPFSSVTVLPEDAYPIYRRRCDNNRVVVRKHHLDNRWVVPYNPFLLEKFDCHINVGICAGIKCVKYIFKYIYKGHDRVRFHLSDSNMIDEYDEITEYQTARWISPPEAAWRIYSFNLAKLKPAVIHLQVHLHNFQYIQFCSKDKLDTIVNDGQRPGSRSQTMLTEFFKMNTVDEDAKNFKLLYIEFPEHFVWSTKSKTWHLRKQQQVIGRMVSVNPTEGERYYLRLLLMNVRAPKSYQDLRTVNHYVASTFREAAEKLGLLKTNDSIEVCIQEAILYQMPCSLRHLFATMLLFCDLPNPRFIWNKYKFFFCEDLIRTGLYTTDEVDQKVLRMIHQILQQNGRSLMSFDLVSDYTFLGENESHKQLREVEAERRIQVSEYDLLCVEKLNTDQKTAYSLIMNAVNTINGRVFFVDGPGGSGKTFLYRCLLASVRSGGGIALATASSGIAASILPGGRTAHSRFKIPIDGENKLVCNISKQSAEGMLLKECRLILWDEASMANRKCVETMHKSLQDLMNSEQLFGGKVIVFGGDFRQTLPVIRYGTKEDFIDASLVRSSIIWPHMNQLKLSENMRAIEDPAFCEYLLRIGNGSEPTFDGTKIKIPHSFLLQCTQPGTALDNLIAYVYPSLDTFHTDPYGLMQRGMLTTKNEFVDEINSKLIDRFPGEERCYLGFDEPLENSKFLYCEDYLHTISPAGMPPHRLILKKNCPLILLRNLNPSEGLCNGTRLICDMLGDHVIGCIIASGENKGKHVFIPKIPLHLSVDDNCPIPFKRHQFPLKLCFAMTINKSQGQTLDVVGIYLKEPVFSHAQLYVAMFRARRAECVKLVIHSETDPNKLTTRTNNIVYPEILDCIHT